MHVACLAVSKGFISRRGNEPDAQGALAVRSGRCSGRVLERSTQSPARIVRLLVGDEGLEGLTVPKIAAEARLFAEDKLRINWNFARRRLSDGVGPRLLSHELPAAAGDGWKI